jgi:hypothetical protein
MKRPGHPNLGAVFAPAKLFTVGCGQEFAALASPTMNNFG